MVDLRVPVTSDELPGRSPLGVVKRDPEPHEIEEIISFAASELGFILGGFEQDSLNTLASIGEEWQWEDAQLKYFGIPGWYVANKPRQMGMSVAFSVLALARGILASRNYTAIFASYKKEEAINKINYVKAFLECLPLAFRKEIIRDPLQLIEWKNQNGTIAKVISHAQKPIRGHHGDVWLDEFAFFQDDKMIYESCLPVVSQVNGSIHIGSTPFGKAGLFYEIVSDRMKHDQFTKQWIGWWHCRRYLKDPSEEGWRDAVLNATKYSTEERVYRYGNAKIITQFRGLDLETFQQEFEGLFVDEQAFFFSRQLIMDSMFDNMSDIFDDYMPISEDFTIPIEEALANNKFSIQKVYPNVDFRRYDTIEGLAHAVRNRKVTPNLYAGVDVGITRHSTDIRILEEIPVRDPIGGQASTIQVERFAKNKGGNQGGWAEEEQRQFLLKMLNMGIIQRLIIDANGVGRPMADFLKARHQNVVQYALFNNAAEKRNRFMNNLKQRMRHNGLALCYDRQTIEDLHCIKSVVTQNKVQRIRTEEKKLHHGDAAWALAFASFAGTKWGEEFVPVTAAQQSNIVMPGYEISQPGLSRAEDIENQSRDKAVKDFLSKLKIDSDAPMFPSSGFGSGYGESDPGPFIHNWNE